MKTKFFTKNEKGKIEFTENELKALLDEIYNEGYHDGKGTSYTYTTPYIIKPYITNPLWQYDGTWCTADSTTATKDITTTATISGASNSTSTIKGDK